MNDDAAKTSPNGSSVSEQHSVAPIGTDAYCGIVGDIVNAVAPYSEATSEALVFCTLAYFGFAVGSRPYFYTDGARQTANIYVALVGPTSTGRKGTAARHVRNLFTYADLNPVDSQFLNKHTMSALDTGQGLVHRIRDPRPPDPGVTDKRLLVVESEFAKQLNNMKRESNNLSATLRQAWDGDVLESGAKSNPDVCTNPHVSIIAHITPDELTRTLTMQDSYNGYGNRFLWPYTKSDKCFPDGGRIDEMKFNGIVRQLYNLINGSIEPYHFQWDEEAHTLWCKEYPKLREDAPGVFGALTSRGPAQVVRMALIYALIDPHNGGYGSYIRVEHLKAALACWKYNVDSVRFVFGDASLFKLDNKIMQMLRGAGGEGLSATEIYNKCGNNVPADDIHRSLEELEKQEKVYWVEKPTKGRPEKRWYAGRNPFLSKYVREHPHEGHIN